MKKMKEVQTFVGWNADQPKIEEPLLSAFANCGLPMLPFKRFPVILLRDFPTIGLYKGAAIDAEYNPIGVVYLAKRSVNDEYQKTFYSGAIEGKDYEKDSDENSH
jgi:hypothetical protein